MKLKTGVNWVCSQANTDCSEHFFKIISQEKKEHSTSSLVTNIFGVTWECMRNPRCLFVCEVSRYRFKTRNKHAASDSLLFIKYWLWLHSLKQKSTSPTRRRFTRGLPEDQPYLNNGLLLRKVTLLTQDESAVNLSRALRQIITQTSLTQTNKLVL